VFNITFHCRIVSLGYQSFTFVQLLSSFIAKKVLIFLLYYLKTFQKGRVIIDNSYPDHSVYPVEDHSNWMELYPDPSEEIAKDLPPEKDQGQDDCL
jgi:hypothetical protein